MKIIDRLKVFIQVSGLSVQDCADEIGVSFPTLYRLLNGTTDKSAVLRIDAFLDKHNFYPQKQTIASKPTEERQNA